jgi:hypothetical protein
MTKLSVMELSHKMTCLTQAMRNEMLQKKHAHIQLKNVGQIEYSKKVGQIEWNLIKKLAKFNA